jgi:1-deoxy-D-xylulose-5-phosphate reductoisomerase
MALASMAASSPARRRPKKISILGSTGSIGCSTVDLIRRKPEEFVVEALTANTDVDTLSTQARELGAKFAAVADPSRYLALKDALAGSGVEVAAGAKAIVEAAQRPADFAMAAIVGAAGLEPTLAAVDAGRAIGLANKECLVCAGDLMMERVKQRGATLLPVDSEHNAIFQVFDFARADTVERIILTASGGPFLNRELADIAKATPAEAIAHPNWDMGEKISVDSATMMNKGLELIEAHYLFAMPEERIDILIHPQSVVHSLVSYVDGSVLAQLGTPDMRTPIAYALAWPERIPAPTKRLDLVERGQLTFEAPDTVRFPALRLAREALRAGGLAPTVLNAANEAAVAAFLGGQIGFLDIAATVEQVLADERGGRAGSIGDVLEADRAARRKAGTLIAGVRR